MAVERQLERWRAGRSRWVFGLLVVGAFATVAIVAYDKATEPEEPMLRAMLAEPIASLSPNGGRVVRTFRYGPSTSLGKHYEASLSQTFAYPDQARADVAQQTLLRRARTSGWIDVEFDGDVGTGWKKIDGRWVQLSIGDYEQDGEIYVGVHVEDCGCLYQG